MKKCTIFLTVIFFLTVPLTFGDDLIDLGSSNQSTSTMGFEQNQYDWLISPADFDKITDSTLFFSLDRQANQFGEDVVGDGFRGGYAWIRDGFSPLIALNYRTNSNSTTEESNDNTVLDYNNYDSATALYATIDESVNISSTTTPRHWLMAHIGGEVGGVGNIDLQISWLMYRETGETTTYSDTYTNTASVSDASLTTKGTLTETTYNQIGPDDNYLIFEPEMSFVFKDIKTLVSLGIGLYNPGTSDDSWSQDQTFYSLAAGSDDTLTDRVTETSETGSFYYTGGSSTACFGMNTNMPVYVERYLINLDTISTLDLKEDLELKIPVYFGINLYPDLSTVEITDTTNYNDTTTLQTSRTVNKTITDLSVDNNIRFGMGGKVKKTYIPSDNSMLYIGANLNLDIQMYSDSRSRTESTLTLIDGNNDGLYTSAVNDTNTLYTLSGWEIETTQNDYAVSMDIPIAVSYSPVKTLTFHAGTTTTMTIQFTDSSSSELWDSNSDYIFETFTDNLVSANSYTTQQINNSDPSSTPSDSFDTNFYFTTAGSFGFTLEISDDFTIDALAIGASNMQTYSFSLSGIYVLP